MEERQRPPLKIVFQPLASLQFKEHGFPGSPQSNRTHLRRHSSLCRVEQRPESRTQFPPYAQTYGFRQGPEAKPRIFYVKLSESPGLSIDLNRHLHFSGLMIIFILSKQSSGLVLINKQILKK
ncbi:MAG: hypothetical protein K0S39_5579 [Paenibacillus sp.]|nr:hypothetical protein [Paenibacillus sp.]